jgi:hypothetical protein
MSSRKNANMPLNKSPAKGCIMALPASPLIHPTAIEPSSRCAPSVNESCSTPRSDRAGAGCEAAIAVWLLLVRRRVLASRTAMMMAGDSITTSATVMWPPTRKPLDSRNCIAATKLTALTEP